MLGGSVGTGGGASPLNSPLNPLCWRRLAPEIVAYPSRMFPFDARVLRRALGACREDRSGIDFFARRELDPPTLVPLPETARFGED